MSDLPPLDQPQAYVVVGPDDQRGPYTLELLIGEVVAGRLHESTPVWWPGLADWTTMSAHPAIAAEIQQRRNPAPAASAFAPPVAVPPPPAEPQAPAQPEQPAPGQYQQAETYGYTQSGGGYPAQATPGQDYSTEMYAGNAVYANPAIDPTPAQEPMAAVSEVDQNVSTAHDAPVEAQDATWMAGETTVAAEVAGGDEADVPSGTVDADITDAVVVDAVDITPADFASVDQSPAGFTAAGPAQGLDPRDGQAFADLVTRSRARADAASIVADIDSNFVGALGAAVATEGLTETARNDEGDSHRVSYAAGDSATLDVTLDKVTGQAMAVRDGHVALDVSYRSSTYGGGAQGGTGEHGEITVTTEEWGGAATSQVSLLLPLADYVSEDYTVDRAALERDLHAVVASVRHKLG